MPISNRTNQKYASDRCLNYQLSEAKLKKHVEDCSTQKAVQIDSPRQGTEKATIKCNRFERRQRVPYIVYADLECLIKPIASEFIHSQRVIACTICNCEYHYLSK